LSDERRQRALENRVLRGIFGPKRDEETRELIKLYNEELNDLSTLQNIIRLIKLRIIKWLGHGAGMGGPEVHTGFWWGNLREREQMGKQHRREDNIKMDLQDLGSISMDWIDLAPYGTGGGHL
jgi:hypothetical protein